jgi:hypothetical protein
MYGLLHDATRSALAASKQRAAMLGSATVKIFSVREVISPLSQLCVRGVHDAEPNHIRFAAPADRNL